MNQIVIIVVSVTAIVSVAIALVLVRIAKINASLDLRRTAAAVGKEKDAADLSAIEKEISEAVSSTKDKKELAKKLGETFGKEIKRHAEAVEAETSRKYEKVIEERKASEQIVARRYKKVLQDKKQTEAIMQSVAEGLVVVDKKGKVLLMNPAAEKILDTKREDKINKSLLADLKDGQLVSLAKEGRKKDAGPKTIEFKSNQDETQKVIRSSSAVVQNENGQTVGMVSVLTDITKQRELDKMKANFVNTVTHEFRTPIVAMQKSILVMLSGATGRINDAQEKFLSIAKRNLERLNLLIDDLLNLSKLEERKMSLTLSNCSLEEVINDVSETVNTWAESKAIFIKKNLQPDLPKPYADPNRIAQVMNNLLSNAIKFTPQKGTITVEAKAIEKGKMVQVSVADSGIGMEKGDEEKIFDKFFQIGERTTTNVTGTGLGLPITKEIVEMHNGEIWVESVKGQGSTFIFTLPVID